MHRGTTSANSLIGILSFPECHVFIMDRGARWHVPARGVPPKGAEAVARILMANPNVALDTHARVELGVDPGDLGSS